MPQDWEACIYSLFDQANNLYGWCALLALIIIQYTRILFMKHSRTLQVLKNDVGVVSVSRSAFNDLIYGVCSQVKMAGHPSIRLRARRGKVYLRVKLRLYTDQSLSDISVYLQDQITQALKDNLGVERIGAIDVCVTSFRKGKRPVASKDLETASGQEEL